MMWMAWLLIIIISIVVFIFFSVLELSVRSFLSFFFLSYFSITEDDSESHIIKLTAFFTSILLTISVAIFFIIVLRKNREHPTVNEDPSKKVHLGKTWKGKIMCSHIYWIQMGKLYRIVSGMNETWTEKKLCVLYACIYRIRSIWDNASGDERGTAKICGLVHAQRKRETARYIECSKIGCGDKWWHFQDEITNRSPSRWFIRHGFVVVNAKSNGQFFPESSTAAAANHSQSYGHE